jgi:hypothetical protein
MPLAGYVADSSTKDEDLFVCQHSSKPKVSGWRVIKCCSLLSTRCCQSLKKLLLQEHRDKHLPGYKVFVCRQKQNDNNLCPEVLLILM